jgi:hypothetical protein
MDYDAVLAHPIGHVFGHLADPARLGGRGAVHHPVAGRPR